MRSLAAALALLAAVPAGAAGYGDVDEVRFVGCYDGDTCIFQIPGWPPIAGEKIPVRIRGIDTPERRGRCAEEKRLAMRARALVIGTLAKARTIRLVSIERGKYFRILATVEADGRDVAELLVQAGLARRYQGGTRAPWCAR